MNPFLFSAGLSGFIAVGLGAFGSHALRDRLGPDMLRIWETAVQYHLVHALALLGIAVMLAHGRQPPMLTWAGWCFLGGTVVFCGSLYILALSGMRWLGAVTPLGGLLFLAGWALVALAALRNSTAP